jgi:hypothetical protein
VQATGSQNLTKAEQRVEEPDPFHLAFGRVDDSLIPKRNSESASLQDATGTRELSLENGQDVAMAGGNAEIVAKDLDLYRFKQESALMKDGINEGGKFHQLDATFQESVHVDKESEMIHQDSFAVQIAAPFTETDPHALSAGQLGLEHTAAESQYSEQTRVHELQSNEVEQSQSKADNRNYDSHDAQHVQPMRDTLRTSREDLRLGAATEPRAAQPRPIANLHDEAAGHKLVAETERTESKASAALNNAMGMEFQVDKSLESWMPTAVEQSHIPDGGVLAGQWSVWSAFDARDRILNDGGAFSVHKMVGFDELSAQTSFIGGWAHDHELISARGLEQVESAEEDVVEEEDEDSLADATLREDLAGWQEVCSKPVWV